MTDNLTSAIDQLGAVMAQKAELEKREKALKAVLIEQGAGAYEGDLFRVTVSHSERESLDMVAVRDKLSRQFIAAHTRITPVTTVRVTARNALQLRIVS